MSVNINGMPMISPQMINPQVQQQMSMQPLPMIMQSAPQLPMMMQQPVYINSLSQLPVGAVPLSHGMLAQALGQGQIGAQMMPHGQAPNTAGTVVGTALKFAAIGAGAGALVGAIPVIPPGLVTGALIGGVVGAGIGIFKGIKKANDQKNAITIMQQQQGLTADQLQAQQIAMNLGGNPQAPTVEDTAQLPVAPVTEEKAAPKKKSNKKSAGTSKAKAAK